jgi:hypothetical protein
VSAGGRPRAELTDKQRVELLELAEHLGALEAEVRQVRHELEQKARAAAEGGASYRAIGEALGLSRGRVHALLAAR